MVPIREVRMPPTRREGRHQRREKGRLRREERGKPVVWKRFPVRDAVSGSTANGNQIVVPGASCTLKELDEIAYVMREVVADDHPGLCGK